jgi:hypothetical protein
MAELAEQWPAQSILWGLSGREDTDARLSQSNNVKQSGEFCSRATVPRV